MGKKKKAKAAQRNDAFSNVMTGMGRMHDKVKATGVSLTNHYRPDQASLETLYEADGLARRIVDAPAEAMTREWIEIEQYPKVLGMLEDAKAKQGVTDMLCWARLYGGAIAVIGLDDSANLTQPVNEAAVKNVLFVRAYDRHQVTIEQGDMDDDPLSRNFGMPKQYRVIPTLGGAPFVVHHSRVMRMDGDRLPDRALASNNYWGASILWAGFESVRDIAVAYHAAAHLVHEFTITQVGIENLSDLLQTEGGEATLIMRLLNLDLTKGYMKTVVTDANETYTRHNASVTGLPELLTKFAERLSSVTGIPLTVLMGQSPAGLNATGESDMRNWYDTIRAEQEDKLRGELEKLVKYALIATEGKEPADWHFAFRSLWSPSEKEEEETKKMRAERVDRLAMAGIIELDEARKELGYEAMNGE